MPSRQIFYTNVTVPLLVLVLVLLLLVLQVNIKQLPSSQSAKKFSTLSEIVSCKVRVSSYVACVAGVQKNGRGGIRCENVKAARFLHIRLPVLSRLFEHLPCRLAPTPTAESIQSILKPYARANVTNGFELILRIALHRYCLKSPHPHPAMHGSFRGGLN